MLSFSLLMASAGAGLADAPPPDRQKALIALLHQDCGACHGMTLQGGLGPALLPEKLKDKTDELLTATILQGRAGTAMPPWDRFLTPAEAGWLVSQLRHPSSTTD